MVVKADGLAAGKGVIVAHDARGGGGGSGRVLRGAALRGRPRDTVLIEEFLEGEEVSLLSIVSGQQILPLAPAQDYKRALDGDAGPNTGGMGSYSPVPAVDDALYERLVDEVVRPTVAELSRRGIDFRGVLYAGLMLTTDGPKVLEFNCRFGDPETQALLPRLESDLLELLWAAATAASACRPRPSGGRAPRWAWSWPRGAIRPRAPRGTSITGLERVRASGRRGGVPRGHQGRVDGAVVTSGGRVLTVTGLGDTFAEARARAYAGVAEIGFEGEQHRSDIALRAEKWEKRRDRRAAADAKGSDMTDQPLVGILMGSQSDAEVMDVAAKELEARGIPYEVNVLSAHRDPEAVREYSLSAESRGLKVIIAGAGKAAALPGVVASMTDLPVIGVPIRTSDLGGLDSLLSMVQMPPGVPVATVAINGARNAAILAAKILRVAGLAGRPAPGAAAPGSRRRPRAALDDPALLHPRDGGHLDRRGPHGGLAAGGAGRVRGLDPAGQDPRGRHGRDQGRRPPSTSTG